MSDEPIKPNPSQAEVDALKAEVESMRKKNAELLDDYKKSKRDSKSCTPEC